MRPTLPRQRPLLMGILNATPDSFFDGGKYLVPPVALERAARMLEEGAHILDLGGESSRPGAAAVPAEEESARVIPILRRIKRRFPSALISIDTRKSEVARAALEAGAAMVNDVSGLAHDPEMARVLAAFKPWVVLMHMRGEPGTMQGLARYRDVVREVRGELEARVLWAVRRGVRRDRIWIDPGIGFAKTAGQNLILLQNLGAFRSLGLPVLVGCSRKSFLGAAVSEPGMTVPPQDRLEGSIAAALWCRLQGASALRVHDVRQTARALRTLDAIRSGRLPKARPRPLRRALGAGA